MPYGLVQIIKKSLQELLWKEFDLEFAAAAQWLLKFREFLVFLTENLKLIKKN